MSRQRIIRSILVVAASAVLGACATEPQDGRDYSFGGAVRNMVQQQIYDPAAAQNPSTVPNPVDGARVEETLKSYRKDSSEAEKAPEVFVVR